MLSRQLSPLNLPTELPQFFSKEILCHKRFVWSFLCCSVSN